MNGPSIRLCCLAVFLAPPAVAAQLPTIKPAAEPVPHQQWRLLYLDGERAGFERTRFRFDPQTQTHHAEQNTRLRQSHFGSTVATETRLHVESDTNGALRSFRLETLRRGRRAELRIGEVADSRLLLETRQGGRVSRSSAAWTPRTRSSLWLSHLLLTHPLQPGDRIRLDVFQPDTGESDTLATSAGRWRKVSLPDGRRLRLLPLTQRNTTGRGTVVDYMDETGQIALSERTHAGIALRKQLVPAAVALATEAGVWLNNDLSRTVLCSRPLANPRKMTQAVYTIQGPALVSDFDHGGNQTALSTGDGIRVSIRKPAIVRTIRHTRSDRSYLRATKMLNANDPNVSSLAREAAVDQTDPAQIAAAMQTLVHRLVRNTVFSSEMNSASVVARTRRGDCTEHAVLLAAMLRAQRIPSRVATGLVYVEGQTSFAPHMWTEAFINGSWTSWDAAFGDEQPGAGYIKVAHSSLSDEDAPQECFLPLLDLLGKISITVVEYE